MTTNSRRPTMTVIVIASLATVIAGLANCYLWFDEFSNSVSHHSARTEPASPKLADPPAAADLAGQPRLNADQAAVVEKYDSIELAYVAIVFADQTFHTLRILLHFDPFSPTDWGRVPRALSWVRVIPIYSSNRDIRARQLIFHSEDLKDVPEIWERAWAMEMPDVATPYRVHGGVI